MASGHGVAWWGGLDEPRKLLVGDHIVGLTESVASNLAQAAMHLSRYAELRDALDFETRQNVRSAAARGGVFGPRTVGFDNRNIEADGHFTGFFRAVGSVLDNLAGLVVGASGMPMNVVKASWSDLAGWSAGASKAVTKHQLTSEHGGMISTLVSQIDIHLAGTPTHWLEWTLDYRNSLVHRASRLSINVIDDRSRSGVAHPIPRHPAQTQAESFAMSRDITQDVIRRETYDTMQLVLGEVLALTRVVGSACVDVWAARRADPNLHLQPRALWPKLQQGRRLQFDGAGRQANISAGSFLAMNPTLSERLSAARLSDGDRPQWKTWLAADETVAGATS